ncbi:low molecular weight protein-tyrosine-phosphatase [Streptantibioticus silvisoli]|uniref:protein-tyrosine-phosphatase n=1 Tax=Streptantibioticus silvisoli TaxID=2705255 RepID=A0ABT6W147_9ACTN|nr:low molecular weight protein-tyrosine-phosphatase [Streptantibioticus silvisoli]MDI5964404.1 low molecular weight protein-tyrosine-phosphatase [Streptantibioticus silvisoli]
MHICFVCTGNICRSPSAAAVFAHQVQRAGLADRVRVTSAGTGPWHVGEPMDTRSGRALAARGYPTAHTAAQVGGPHLGADLLVALDDWHRAELLDLVDDPQRVVLLRSFDPAAGDDLDVPDPYYGGADGFDDVLTMIEAATPGLLAHVRERLER